MVVVDEGDAHAAFFAANADFFGDVVKFSSAIVVKEMDAIGEADGQIGVAVVVEIACGAAEAAAGDFEAGFFRDVGEFSVAQIVEQAAGAVGCRADEKEIGFAIAVVVEETCAGAWADWRRSDGRGCEVWTRQAAARSEREWRAVRFGQSCAEVRRARSGLDRRSLRRKAWRRGRRSSFGIWRGVLWLLRRCRCVGRRGPAQIRRRRETEKWRELFERRR